MYVTRRRGCPSPRGTSLSWGGHKPDHTAADWLALRGVLQRIPRDLLLEPEPITTVRQRTRDQPPSTSCFSEPKPEVDPVRFAESPRRRHILPEGIGRLFLTRLELTGALHGSSHLRPSCPHQSQQESRPVAARQRPTRPGHRAGGHDRVASPPADNPLGSTCLASHGRCQPPWRWQAPGSPRSWSTLIRSS